MMAKNFCEGAVFLAEAPTLVKNVVEKAKPPGLISSICSCPGKKSKLWSYFLALRPWSFTMTVISVAVGSIMGLLLQGAFSFGLALLVLIGMIAIHGATNLLNDYFDTIYGVDKPGAPTTLYRLHPIVSGLFSPRQALLFSLVLYSVTALIAIYIVGFRGWPIAALTITGGCASVAYTAGPIKYKYRGMGEISVFLMWGPLMTLGSYFVQTGVFEGAVKVLFVSLPLGMLVAVVLLANNLKDLAYDSEMKINTLAVRLGPSRSLKLFAWLIFGAYFLSSLEIFFGYLSWWAIAIFFSLPLALHLIYVFNKDAGIPPDADPRTARLSTVFGLLVIFSLLTGYFIPFP